MITDDHSKSHIITALITSPFGPFGPFGPYRTLRFNGEETWTPEATHAMRRPLRPLRPLIFTGLCR